MWVTLNGVTHFFVWREGGSWVSLCGKQEKIISGNDLAATMGPVCPICDKRKNEIR